MGVVYMTYYLEHLLKISTLKKYFTAKCYVLAVMLQQPYCQITDLHGNLKHYAS